MNLFSFGYFGWGNATRELVAAVDAVEAARGFAPPMFVDIRFRRAVRAKGFVGNAFRDVAGAERYRWMKGLGNRAIGEGGPRVIIDDPAAAEELLALALECDRRRQRVLFFCSCEFPFLDGRPHCHRCEVAGLVRDAARRRSADIDIIEWPDGEPVEIDLDVEPKFHRAVRRGRKSVPLGRKLPAPALLGLPWGSLVTLRGGAERLGIVAGPARYAPSGWELRVYAAGAEPEGLRVESRGLREQFGLGAGVLGG